MVVSTNIGKLIIGQQVTIKGINENFNRLYDNYSGKVTKIIADTVFIYNKERGEEDFQIGDAWGFIETQENWDK